MNNLNINKNLTINNPSIRPTGQAPNLQKSFQEILGSLGKDKELKFSKHALDRLESRSINLTKNEIARINGAIQKANEKGVKEALILMGNKAFIASVKNNTIITATTEHQLKENVFTNIDGAVIV